MTFLKTQEHTFSLSAGVLEVLETQAFDAVFACFPRFDRRDTLHLQAPYDVKGSELAVRNIQCTYHDV